MSLEYAINADIRVHSTTYEYEGSEVRYHVDEDAAGKYRAVCAEARRGPDGERIDYEVDGVRLTPTRWQRLRERLTAWEFEAEPEWEQVQRVTEQMEAAIERVRRTERRHEDCEVPSSRQ